jgi:glucokinase
MYLGLDIGGTKTAALLGDPSGKIHQRMEIPTKSEDGFECCFNRIVDLAKNMISTNRERADIEGVGVSIGGPMDAYSGTILSPPNLPGWDDIPLKTLLENRFNAPAVVEHDGNAGALAEWYYGAGRGVRNLVFITMGTGFGAGLILEGRLIRGASCLAGEIGHIRAAEDGPEAFGKRGAFEGLCSGAAIGVQAHRMFPDKWKSSTTAKDVTDAVKTGDADALKVIQLTGRYVGRALAILCDCLNPELILIGSMAIRLGDMVLQPALDELRREALPGAVAACRIGTPALGGQLGDYAPFAAIKYNLDNR